ncbi:hypothetical protein F5Y03DRAFT_390117 [Xylaria venustula]|nr:hypothetical protein F5Y03DRAFT_390117 [Xylaria venustula]
MGRARKNRRTRASYGGNGSKGRRNEQDRDDDFYMQGTERNNGASPLVRRGRGGYIPNKSSRNSDKECNGDGASQDHNLPDPFSNHPFDPFDDLSWYGPGDDWSTRSPPRQRGRSRRNHDHRGAHNDHDIANIDYVNVQDDPYMPVTGFGRGRAPLPLPLPLPAGRGRGRGRGGFGSPTGGRGRGYNRGGSQKSPAQPSHSPPALHKHHHQQPPFSCSSSPGRAPTRFCTECSSVRRANLRLRDWVSAGVSRASEVLESWSDEVGVGRGSGDEMDWQPEPVVRVLIVSNSPTPSPSIPPSSVVGASFGTSYWHPDSFYGYKGPETGEVCSGGGGEVAVNNMTGSSSWGLRPDALGPEFHGGESGVWGNGGGGVCGPKDETSCSAQKIDGHAGLWTPHVFGSQCFGSQCARMMTPPGEPLSVKA